ncbi:MAG: sigma-70 family RNA polymerase sigma factor [Deltaproteobacteria bacterium]|nr:sigma-70 family RNA polymerase sigma factor [Deltaproteobacteria bacterium]
MIARPRRPMGAAAKHDDGESADAVLLAAAAAGDERAFADLVRRYERRFYAVARRMLGDDGEAEDAVQTALLQIHRHAPAYRPQWSGSTWLYRILTNVCIDLWRKRRRRDGLADAPELRAAGPRDAERIDVDRALAKLPAEARAILLLCYVEELSYREVARVRGVTVNTVKTQLARAKRALRRHLSEVNR